TSDGTGVVCVSGITSSTDLPTLNAFQPANAGGQDGYVMKLDTTATGAAGLLWSTYLGTDSTDYARGLAQDGAGNVYVVGQTSGTAWPGASTSPIQSSVGGGVDGFVTALSSNGALRWGTYQGGNGTDILDGVAVAPDGNVVVTGSEGSTGFLGTAGAYQVS